MGDGRLYGFYNSHGLWPAGWRPGNCRLWLFYPADDQRRPDGGWLFGEAIEAPVPLLAGLQLAALGGVAEPGFDTSSDPALIADAIIPGIVLDDLAAEGTGEDLRG